MAKAFVVVGEEEQVWLQRICIDADAREALEFLRRVVLPQLKKEVPCMRGKIGTGE
ncbi:MAG: hypothetical protein QME70_08020 [Bacillota bacterium]|nr:hypothetical protein [Bacillota bacterium]